jgi:hypothetical protein
MLSPSSNSIKISCTALFLGLLLFGAPTDITRAFDPSFIVSDTRLFNSTAMNQLEIQRFLEQKGSYLATFRTIDHLDGIEKLASEIIYNASQQHVISPEYLLVVLQKEQSLIQGSLPNQYRLDWATGYAMCDSCNRNTPGIDKYKGFSKQVYASAAQTRYYVENPHRFNFKVGNLYTISGQDVLVLNAATAALYNYTPHLHGNKNLSHIWNTWFSQKHPHGSLLKTATSPDVWYIHYGRKRKVMSMGVLKTRFGSQPITEVAVNELDKYEEAAPLQFPQYSLLRDENDKRYLLQNETLRPIASVDVYRRLGFAEFELIDVLADDLEGYTIGDTISLEHAYPLGALLQDTATGGVYWVQDGKRAPIIDMSILKNQFGTRRIQATDAAGLESYTPTDPIRLKDGTLIKADNSPTVYVTSDDAKYPITNGEIFESRGYTWDAIITVPQRVLDLYRTEKPLE